MVTHSGTPFREAAEGIRTLDLLHGSGTPLGVGHRAAERSACTWRQPRPAADGSADSRAVSAASRTFTWVRDPRRDEPWISEALEDFGSAEFVLAGRSHGVVHVFPSDEQRACCAVSAPRELSHRMREMIGALFRALKRDRV